MLPLIVFLQVVTARVVGRARSESGQTTAEYALVLLGAAAVALLVLTWANQTDKVGALLNKIMNSMMDKVS
jgi:Flp pilus assembly pilin Flp